MQETKADVEERKENVKSGQRLPFTAPVPKGLPTDELWRPVDISADEFLTLWDQTTDTSIFPRDRFTITNKQFAENRMHMHLMGLKVARMRRETGIGLLSRMLEKPCCLRGEPRSRVISRPGHS